MDYKVFLWSGFSVFCRILYQLFNLNLLTMKRTVGLVLTVVGLVATIITGIQAMNESESFSFLGMDVGVSSADWTPLIISVIVLIVGLVLAASSRGK